MSLSLNYYHAEMLANLISQTRFALKGLKQKGYLSPQATVLEYQTIHFGGMRGSGHSKAIEDLTHVYKSTIVQPEKYYSRKYGNVAPNTICTWLEEVMRPGMNPDPTEVMFIDNWIHAVLPKYPDVPDMLQRIAINYDAYNNDTIFVLVH